MFRIAHMRLVGRAALACALVLLACACSPERTSEREENTFRFALASDPETLDPARVTGTVEGRIVQQLYEGLVTFAPSGDEVAPGVAERWEVAEDGVTYRFYLRENAAWSNGDPLTAEDFVYAWRRVLRADVVAEYLPFLFYLQGAEQWANADLASGERRDPGGFGARSIDDHTLEVVLSEPTPYFLQMLTFPVFFPVHRPSIDAHGQREAFEAGRLVSNGAFALESYRLQSRITMRRNPRYWDAGNVAMQRIEAQIIPDSAAAVLAYQQGRVDWVPELPDEQLRFLAAEPGFREDSGWGTYFFRLNTTRAPLDDVRVRRALALALDRGSLCRCTINGAAPAAAMVPPIRGYDSPDGLAYDPAEARRLLAEAGYPDGEGFPSLTLLYNTSANHRTIAQALQDMWKVELNIDIELENREWRVYLSAMDALDFDIARAGWIGDYVDPNTFLELWTSGNPNNDTGFSSQRFDAAIAAARQEAEPARRASLLRSAEEELLAQVPVIPLYFYAQQQLVDPDVCGFSHNLRNVHLARYLQFAPCESSEGADGDELTNGGARP